MRILHGKSNFTISAKLNAAKPDSIIDIFLCYIHALLNYMLAFVVIIIVHMYITDAFN